MRRLVFPIVMPYFEADSVVHFMATRQALLPLGEPGYIEEDSLRTAGGREFFWAFETWDGLRFMVRWAEPYEDATVVADPPDAARAMAALQELGLGGLPLVARPIPGEHELQRHHARGAVWLFTPEGMQQPTAVFSRKPLADQWLARNRLSGTLRAHPLDISSYEFERTHDARSLPPPDSDEARRYVGTMGERYEYVEGTQLDDHPLWQLWRQDDNGNRFLVADFNSQSEAAEALEKLEASAHKQMYWLSRREERK